MAATQGLSSLIDGLRDARHRGQAAVSAAIARRVGVIDTASRPGRLHRWPHAIDHPASGPATRRAPERAGQCFTQRARTPAGCVSRRAHASPPPFAMARSRRMTSAGHKLDAGLRPAVAPRGTREVAGGRPDRSRHQAAGLPEAARPGPGIEKIDPGLDGRSPLSRGAWSSGTFWNTMRPTGRTLQR